MVIFIVALCITNLSCVFFVYLLRKECNQTEAALKALVEEQNTERALWTREAQALFREIDWLHRRYGQTQLVALEAIRRRYR
jgi:hypothetical protein